MRLGIAQWSYQWFFAPPAGMFIDRREFAYAHRGLPQAYVMSTPRHVSQASPSDPIEWLIARCRQLGAAVAHCSITRWDDQRYLDRVKRLLDEHRLELIPSNGADMVCTGDQAKRGQEACIAGLRRYHAFGGVRTVKFATPMTYNRFDPELPVDEQVGLIKENVRPIVAAAAEMGMVLALENHYDYRADEIRDVIEDVDSPHLRALLDVGSPFAVCEEPLHAAKTLAPYAVLVHLKDVRVLPWTPAAGGYHACQYGTPFGEGNVDLKRIVATLGERAPDPDSLCLAIELAPVPPTTDEDRWVEHGVGWCRTNLAEYLSGDRAAAAAGAHAQQART